MHDGSCVTSCPFVNEVDLLRVLELWGGARDLLMSLGCCAFAQVEKCNAVERSSNCVQDEASQGFRLPTWPCTVKYSSILHLLKVQSALATGCTLRPSRPFTFFSITLLLAALCPFSRMPFGPFSHFAPIFSQIAGKNRLRKLSNIGES